MHTYVYPARISSCLCVCVCINAAAELSAQKPTDTRAFNTQKMRGACWKAAPFEPVEYKKRTARYASNFPFFLVFLFWFHHHAFFDIFHILIGLSNYFFQFLFGRHWFNLVFPWQRPQSKRVRSRLCPVLNCISEYSASTFTS